MASVAYIVAHSIPSQMFCIIKPTPKTCCIVLYTKKKNSDGNLRKCYIKILGFFFCLFYFLFSQMFHLDYGPVIYGDHCSKCLSSKHSPFAYSLFFFVPERFAKQVKPPALIVKILGDYIIPLCRIHTGGNRDPGMRWRRSRHGLPISRANIWMPVQLFFE